MKNLSQLLLALSVSAVLGAPAAAAVDAGVDQTFGTLAYRGTKAHAALDLSDSISVTPAFATYRNDLSSGSFYQGGLRLGYQQGPLSLGVSGAFVPKNFGYKQNSVGADLTLSLCPGHVRCSHRAVGPDESNETFGYGLTGLDIGGTIDRITHSDDYFAAGTSGGALRETAQSPNNGLRPKPFTVGETDVSVFASAKFMITEISGSLSKSVYDKTLDNNQLRESPFLVMGEYAAIESGYPDASYSLKIKWKSLLLVRPYLAYTHTDFELGVAPSNATEFGLSVNLDMLNVKAAYGHYSQSGFQARDYFTLGAGLNFGS